MNYKLKKIAIFIPALFGGGAERSMLKLSESIVNAGYKVDLVLARAEGPYLVEVPKSLRLIDLKARRVLTSLPALIRYLRLEKPFALISILHANIIAIIAKRFAGVSTRVIISERNTLSYDVRNNLSDLRMRLTPKLVRYFYPLADGIVAVSKGVADDLNKVIKSDRKRIHVIYNPIVTAEFKKKTRIVIKHPWFEDGEPPVILAVGRLTAQKDFSTLIKAFNKVRRIRPVRLMILGEGEERLSLESLIKFFGMEHDIHLPGFIANPYPYMVRSSLFVLSSKWEGLPGVLIEALYCRIPVIATDCPSGPREILAGGNFGQLVPVGNVDAIAMAITAALDGNKIIPPRESWQLYRSEVILKNYLKVVHGN
jgi:glycosyltransferase involved in cell wall biosynthesis